MEKIRNNPKKLFNFVKALAVEYLIYFDIKTKNNKIPFSLKNFGLLRQPCKQKLEAQVKR